MKKFKVCYGIDVISTTWDEEILEFKNITEAEDYAYDMAVQMYDARASKDDGFRSVETIMDEENLTEQEAVEEYESERMQTIQYSAEDL